MIFGTIKGHNIATVSRKKAEKGNFGTAINSVISEKDLQTEILAALADGGQVYALYQKKEMMACYILTKEMVNLSDYAARVEEDKQEEEEQTEDKGQKKEKEQEEEQDEQKGEQQEQLAFVLKKEYMVASSKEVREQFEKAVLEEVKESTVYQDVKYIAWKDALLVPKKLKLGNWEIAGGIGTGIALGMLFGIALDNLGIGVALGVAFGYMFATTFRTLYRTKEKK